MPTGKCKLCLKIKELQNSHLMPRALYRMARGSGTVGNQDPFLMRAQGGKQSSHQTTDYVLCRDCEQLFSENGESHVMRLVTKRNGEFPLLDMLRGAPIRAEGKNWKVYSTTDVQGVDPEKIAYFALSVFWRASVHSWEQEDGEVVSLDLGKKYNEELRQYLLGIAPLPRNASMTVAACSDEISQKSFFMPSENRKVRDRSVGFGARGLFFMFRITRTPAPWQPRLSMINNPLVPISVWNCLERGVWRLGLG